MREAMMQEATMQEAYDAGGLRCGEAFNAEISKCGTLTLRNTYYAERMQ